MLKQKSVLPKYAKQLREQRHRITTGLAEIRIVLGQSQVVGTGAMCCGPFQRQLCAEGGSHRDPRAPWALSVVYQAMVMASQLAPLAGKRVKQVTWRPVEDVMKDRALAFDHATLVAMAVKATRQEIEQLELPAGILPPQFTLSELQADCEQLLGRRLDKSSFRRRLADRALVEPVHGVTRAGANRPAQVYRLRRVPEPQDNKA